MAITAEALDRATQEQFDSMYTIKEIVKGDTLAMRDAARKIALRTLHIKNSGYGTDTELRMTAEQIKIIHNTFLSEAFQLTYTANSAAHDIAHGLFEYDKTQITLAETMDIVNDVLGTSATWVRG